MVTELGPLGMLSPGERTPCGACSGTAQGTCRACGGRGWFPWMPLGSRAAWVEAVEERAAIIEFDGGVPRDEAERRAKVYLGPPPQE